MLYFLHAMERVGFKGLLFNKFMAVFVFNNFGPQVLGVFIKVPDSFKKKDFVLVVRSSNA